MKKLISLLMSVVMIFTITTPVFATNNTFDNTQISKISDYVTPEGQDFLKKIESILPYFSLDSDNKLTISLTDDELIANYNFTSEDLEQLEELLLFGTFSIKRGSRIRQPRLHVSNWKIYFNNGDVHSFLYAAAQIGPSAIIAALSALGTTYPGVGNVVGALIGVIGGGTIVYYVLQAVALNKGLYMGVNWNGPFPVPAIDLW